MDLIELLQQLKNYCGQHGLAYRDSTNAILDDREEWEGVIAAGFYVPLGPSPQYAILIEDNGSVKAVKKWSHEDPFTLEDEVEDVTIQFLHWDSEGCPRLHVEG